MIDNEREIISQELNLQIQHRLMEELAASERRYRELVERIREVVFKCHEDGTISFLNHAWTDLLGYAVDASLERSLADYIVAGEREEALALISQPRREEAVEESREFRFLRSDGSAMWLMLSLRVGETEGKVGSLYNIDARKQAEAALQEVNEQLEDRVQQRTAQLAESNRELGREVEERKRAQEELRQAFSKLQETQENLLRVERLAVVGETSGRVAHEILNPVTSIFSRVENNIRQWGDFNEWLEVMGKIVEQWNLEYRTGNLGQYLNSISGEATTYGDEDMQLLTTLAQDALAFQQERVGDLRFIFKQLHRVIKIINTLRDSVRNQRMVSQLDLIPAIGEALETMADSLKKRGIKVETELPGQLPPVLADECEMIQIFTNLLRNASQSIEDKGEPDGLIWVSASADGGKVGVRVRDNGSGIAPAHQGAIFDFTFTTKDRTRGTGLGLGISRRFARECGGDLVLDWSAEGVGTCFLLTTPVVPSQEESGHGQ